jgi:hypothetical protein
MRLDTTEEADLVKERVEEFVSCPHPDDGRRRRRRLNPLYLDDDDDDDTGCDADCDDELTETLENIREKVRQDIPTMTEQDKWRRYEEFEKLLGRHHIFRFLPGFLDDPLHALEVYNKCKAQAIAGTLTLTDEQRQEYETAHGCDNPWGSDVSAMLEKFEPDQLDAQTRRQILHCTDHYDGDDYR